MSTLPLYWKLSSAVESERIDASAELVNSLEHFQLDHVPEPYLNGASHEHAGAPKSFVETLAPEDVHYALRRLTRGLASPKESNRIGFAVALTELLQRIPVFTASQVIGMILDAAEISGSVKGQQLRDHYFARMFGFNCIVESGLLYSSDPLPNSTISRSTANDFENVVSQLLFLGNQKAWIRESSWWSLLGTLEGLRDSNPLWRHEALERANKLIFQDRHKWFPEKLAAATKMQVWFPECNWADILSPAFANGDILSMDSLGNVATILREARFDEDEEGLRSGRRRVWRPNLHFAWDTLIDRYRAGDSRPLTTLGDFYRIAVTDSLFDPSASDEMKFWGFKAFSKILACADEDDLPSLMTEVFARLWTYHLYVKDRSLNKVAHEVLRDVGEATSKYPKFGLQTVVVLLASTGGKLSRINRTKALTSIVDAMDASGVKQYVEHLLKTASETHGNAGFDDDAIAATHIWVIEQLGMVIRSPHVPKDVSWVSIALEFLVMYGYFSVKKRDKASTVTCLQRPILTPSPDKFRTSCMQQLHLSLAALLNPSTTAPKHAASSVQAKENEAVERSPKSRTASSLWIARTLDTIHDLERNEKHVSLLRAPSDADQSVRKKARKVIKRLAKSKSTTADGLIMLLQSYLLRSYEETFNQVEKFSDIVEAAQDSLDAPSLRQNLSEEHAAPGSLDLIVDSLIEDLEGDNPFRKDIANAVFGFICRDLTSRTLDLILAQLKPPELSDSEMEEAEAEGGEAEEVPRDPSEGTNGTNTIVELSNGESDSSSDDDESEEEGDLLEDDDLSTGVDLEFRRQIAEALQMEDAWINGNSDDDGYSGSDDSSVMDDDQMMALDDKLTEIFRSSKVNVKKEEQNAHRQATVFKTRVLDFVETFLERNPTSVLVIKTIMPLVSLAAFSSRDEEPLSKKAGRILQKIVGRGPIISNVDVKATVRTLKQLHDYSKRTQDVNPTLFFTTCCHRLISSLESSGHLSNVVEVYTPLLDTHLSKRQSKLPFQLLKHFVLKSPLSAWHLRDILVEHCQGSRSANVFRQRQALELTKDLIIAKWGRSSDGKDEIWSFIPSYRDAICHILKEETAAEKRTFQATQLRDLVQDVRMLTRLTSKGQSRDAMELLWNANGYLVAALSGIKAAVDSKPFQQAVNATQKMFIVTAASSPMDSATKRKQDEDENASDEDDEEALESKKHPKKKRQKKDSA